MREYAGLFISLLKTKKQYMLQTAHDIAFSKYGT
jgi:hypothetical protein